MIIMRYSRDYTAAVRARIVRTAAAALRRRGIDGIGIPALMKRAGLTHGAFYAHFESRDEMVAEAVREAATQTAERLFASQHSLAEVTNQYLSAEHVAHPEDGCVLAALGPEGHRRPAPVKRAFRDAARGMLQLLESRSRPTRRTQAVSDDTVRRASTMIGAVVLARLVDDATLANRILTSARRV